MDRRAPPYSLHRPLVGRWRNDDGDWNYLREGAFFGTEEAVSTAMGTPRNLVFVGQPANPLFIEPEPVGDPGNGRAALR